MQDDDATDQHKSNSDAAKDSSETDDSNEARASDEGEDSNEESDGGAPDPTKGRRSLVPILVAVVLLGGFVGYILYEIFRPRPDVWTDDAYVRVHYTMLAPRVSGKLASIAATDNATVRAGDVLVTIDPRDFETAVAAAEASLARDKAQVGSSSADVDRQPALIDEQKAAVATADASLALAQANARRYNNLAATGAGTVQERQQANTTLQSALAQQQSANASLRAAQEQLKALEAHRRVAEGVVALDEAQLAQARLNLSYTRILAPIDGVIGEKSVQVGDYVTPGMTLMTVVPLADVYIEANYREVELEHMRQGQKATIHVDAYDIDLDGIVDSLPPASGASFAPIAPNNATGNFTKIVQRLPVKIKVTPGQPHANLLRVGFSVETTVHTQLEDIVSEDRRGTAPATPVE